MRCALEGVLLLEVIGFAQIGYAAVEQSFATPALRQAMEEYAAKRRMVIRAQRKLDKVLLRTESSPAAAADPVVIEAQKEVEAAMAGAKEAGSKVLVNPESPPVPPGKAKELKDEVDRFRLQVTRNASAAPRS